MISIVISNNFSKIMIDEKWHPMIFNNLVGIPTLNPGDSVWWHPDLVCTYKNAIVISNYEAVLFSGL